MCPETQSKCSYSSVMDSRLAAKSGMDAYGAITPSPNQTSCGVPYVIFRNSRAGSMISAAISESTPPTAIPRMRKGSNNNQTNGYKTSARSATGQHKTNKMHQSKNLTIGSSCWQSASMITPFGLFKYRSSIKKDGLNGR